MRFALTVRDSRLPSVQRNWGQQRDYSTLEPRLERSVRSKEDDMAQSIRDVMTTHPITLPATSLVVDAARAMRDADIGDVIVIEDGRICGIVTDRDITVRGVAEGRDIACLKLADVCSRVLTTVSPKDSVDDAVRLMRENAIRRLPVVE